MGMLCLEILALAAAMLLVPTLMHQAVCALDDVYDQLGRRARSPWEKGKWLGVILGVAGLSVWHMWLGRLSWGVVLEGAKNKTTDVGRIKGQRGMNENVEHDGANDAKSKMGSISWGRVMSRIVIPLLLVILATHFTYALVCKLKDPRPLVTRNEVDMMDVMSQLYGLGVG